MAKKSKHKKSNLGRRKKAAGMDKNKRGRVLISNSASSWLGNLWTLIRTIDGLKSIFEWVDFSQFI